MQEIRVLLEELESLSGAFGPIPITWFVRADGQLRDVFGTPLYLLEKFDSLWTEVRAAGHELGWHPHLYRHSRAEEAPILIMDPQEAADEIEQLWDIINKSSLSAVSFRNGEGWHHATTFATVERLGFQWDSTAIPGRKGANGHPMDWNPTPNHPYFPDKGDVRLPGRPRALLQIPMNTWRTQAPYDTRPRLRYMNPAVHERIFRQAIDCWREDLHSKTFIWTLILHPDEVFSGAGPDPLYARSETSACRNLAIFANTIKEAGHEVEFVTLSRAGDEFRCRERIV